MANEEPLETRHKKVKRINGVWVLLAVIIFFAVGQYKPSFKSIDCTPEIIATKPDVIMLGAWWCTYCNQAKQYFHSNNIHYCEYDMEMTKTGIKLYEENGGGAIPVILIGDYTLRGYNENQINEALSLLKKNNSQQ